MRTSHVLRVRMALVLDYIGFLAAEEADSAIYVAIIVPLLIVIGCCIFIPIFLWRRKKTKKPADDLPLLPLLAQETGLPKHCVLMKDETLKEKAKELAENIELLDLEYRSLLAFVQENVKKETTVSKLKHNIPHNRYKDIGNGNINCHQN